MATTKTVLHNQTLFDFTIQHTGNVRNIFLIAKTNNLAISDELIPGSDLIIPDEIESNDDVLRHYENKVIQPATAITNILNDTEEPQLEGIGYWIIGDDNIVS